MDRKETKMPRKRTGRHRILLAGILAMGLILALSLIMDVSHTSQVSAEETKEQLDTMLGDLEEMSKVIRGSREKIDEVTGEYGGGEFIFSADGSSLEQAEEEIGLTQAEINELLQAIEEGNFSNLTENYENIQNHFTSLEGDVSASVDEIEKMIERISRDEKSNNKTALTELNAVKEDIASVNDNLKNGDTQIAAIVGEHTDELKSSVSDVSNSVSEMSGQMSREISKTSEKLMKETTDAIADNRDAINRHTDECTEDIIEEIHNTSSSLLVNITSKIEESYSEVFQFVSSGKKRIATALLTNGYTVAKQDGTFLDLMAQKDGEKAADDEAKYIPFETYAASIESGMKSIYQKTAEKAGTDEAAFQSLPDLIQTGGGIDQVYDRGYQDGYGTGSESGRNQGHQDVKNNPSAYLNCRMTAVTLTPKNEVVDTKEEPTGFGGTTTVANIRSTITNSTNYDVVIVYDDSFANVYSSTFQVSNGEVFQTGQWSGGTPIYNVAHLRPGGSISAFSNYNNTGAWQFYNSHHAYAIVLY